MSPCCYVWQHWLNLMSFKSQDLLSFLTCTFYCSLWCVCMCVFCIHWCKWSINKCTIKGKELHFTDSDVVFNITCEKHKNAASNTRKHRAFELLEQWPAGLSSKCPLTPVHYKITSEKNRVQSSVFVSLTQLVRSTVGCMGVGIWLKVDSE